MKYGAAYLLAVLGGKDTPSEDDVKAILEAGGVDVEDDQLSALFSAIGDKGIYQVIAEGKAKLGSVPSGGAGGAGGAAEEAPAEEEAQEEEEEEEEESDSDIGMGGLF